jgi:hypothetical protein
VDGHEDRRGLLLEIPKDTVDIIADKGGNTAIADNDGLGPEFPIRVDYRFPEFLFPAADDIRFVQIGAEPYEALGTGIPELFKGFILTDITDGTNSAAYGAMHDYHRIPDGIEYGQAQGKLAALGLGEFAGRKVGAAVGQGPVTGFDLGAGTAKGDARVQPVFPGGG